MHELRLQAPVCAPLSHQKPLIKNSLGDKNIKNFQMATTENPPWDVCVYVEGIGVPSEHGALCECTGCRPMKLRPG